MTPSDIKRLLDASTPGPWCVVLYGKNRRKRIAGPNNIWRVANVNAGLNFDANAALIAAAPDIARAYLEQCETVARLTAERDAIAAATVERCAAWCRKQAGDYEKSSNEDASGEPTFSRRCQEARDVLLFAESNIRALAAPDTEAMVERCAEKVHDAYLETALRLGWPVKPELNKPYSELPDDAKELDRATARAVLSVLGVGR